MPIVTGYSRTHGDIAGYAPGSSGQLESTRQKLHYVNAPYVTRKMFIEPLPAGTHWQETCKPLVYNALYHDNMQPAWTEREATQLARSRLNKTLINGRAALGITAATANQSFGMIANRANQLRNAWSAARRLNPSALARALNVPKPKELKKRSYQDPASLWLEYTFGWVPLVQDMHQAAVVLTDPFEVTRSYGTATVSRFFRAEGRDVIRYVNKRTRVVCTAGLRITNPNLALLTQLGLSNPAAVVWDIIPFSFVVDWFLKINRFVNTWNDMAGFSYVDPVTTIENKVQAYYWRAQWFHLPAYDNAGNGRSRQRQMDIVNQPMYPSFQLPTPNLWLAATSTALLVQVFGKK